MANNNDGQIVLGLDIPKTVNQINSDIKKLQNQLEQVKATGALDTSTTVKQINAQIASLQSQLKNIGSSFKGQKNDLGAPYWVKCWNTYLRGIRFSVHENEYYTKKYSLEKITVDEKAIDYKKDSTYFIKGLDISVFN